MQKILSWSFGRPFLIGLLAFILACGLLGRWSGSDFAMPIEYGIDGPASDAKSVFALTKAISEGDFPFLLSKKMSKFGAPYTASWDDYPTIEEPQFAATGLLARWIGVFPAVNLVVILGHVTAVLGFYAACRALRYPWIWSAAGAFIFGFSAYLFARNVHHITLVYVWHVPLIILLARWAMTKEGLASKSHFCWALAIAVATGVQNVYYTNMMIQFLGLIMLYQLWLRNQQAALRIFAVGSAAVVAFLVMNLDTLWARLAHGANPGAVSRTYQYLEYSGFKWADLFIPPPNYWISSLAEWGDRYYAEVILKGEVPVGSYLGIAGMVALVLLVLGAARNMAKTPAERPPWEFLLMAWTVFYATVGGVNAWVGSLGFVLFRSTTRYTIFVLALALMYAVRKMAGWTAKWDRERQVVVAALIAAVALWDQVPRGHNENQLQIKEAVLSDQTFAGELEAAVKPGAMVFELPVVNFPESPYPGVPPYDQFRPYFYTHTLRYSFGDIKGRAKNAWQEEMASLSPQEQVERLEKYGFGAIYVNPAGLPDHGEGLMKLANERNLKVIVSPLRDVFAVVLHPSESPVLPPRAPFFGAGWYEVEPDGRGNRAFTSQGKSEIILTNPEATPVKRYLSFYLRGFDDRKMRMEFNGRGQDIELRANASISVRNMEVELQPGENKLTLESDAPRIRTMRGPISFGIVNFKMTEAPLPKE